jgi:hypothetical protein
MASLRKAHAGFIIALALLIALTVLAQPITSYSATETHKAVEPSAINEIVLEANKPDVFNSYNTNGTPPYMSGNSAVFYGSNRTNMYSDIVSLTSINANKSLVLEASVSTSIKNLSNTGEDQFAVFATDDTTKYKSDEFGFVLPETGNTWYAYIQSPQIPGFFVWKPLLTLEPSGVVQHSFKAVYSNVGLLRFVDFYVDGKLLWSAFYPNVSGQSFHMVLCSHKVSAENVDLSQNMMIIGNASLTDSSANGAQNLSYFNVL